MSERRAPEYYAEQARQLESEAIENSDAGKWREAAQQWWRACCASIGHRRRERYAQAEARCLDHARALDVT